MSARITLIAVVSLILIAAHSALAQEKKPDIRLSIDPPHISTDKSVKYDYDIVYVRGRRREDGKEARWAEFSRPTTMEPQRVASMHGTAATSQCTFISIES